MQEVEACRSAGTGTRGATSRAFIQNCKPVIGAQCAQQGIQLLKESKVGNDRAALSYLGRACRLEIPKACILAAKIEAGSHRWHRAGIYHLSACRLGHEPGCEGVAEAMQKMAEAVGALAEATGVVAPVEKKSTFAAQSAQSSKSSKNRGVNPLSRGWLRANMQVEVGCESDPQSCFDRAVGHEKDGNVGQALELLRSVCSLNHAPSCNRAGWLTAQKGRHEDAHALYQEGCRLRLAKACSNLGWSYTLRHDQKAAQLAYQKACAYGHSAACRRVSRKSR